MGTKSLMKASIIIGALLVPMAALACGPGKTTHMGNVLSVDAKNKTFTIQDAETQSAITFVANSEILDGLKAASGMITVNYEESDNGLNAVGVTF